MNVLGNLRQIFAYSNNRLLRKSVFLQMRSCANFRNYPYLVDAAVCRDVAKHVFELTDSDAYVFEARPGQGILSKALLEAGIQHLRVFETEEDLAPALKELATSYRGRLEIFPEDIMNLPSLDVSDYDGSVTGIFYHSVQKHSWKEAAPFSLVSIIADRWGVNFLRYLLIRIATMSSLFACGRCQFFLITSEKEYMRITAEPTKNSDEYRTSSVLHNLFFNISLIGKIPGSAVSSNHLQSENKVNWNSHNMYFLHLVPKPDLFESVAPVDKLPDLYYFIRWLMSNKADLVMQSVERSIKNHVLSDTDRTIPYEEILNVHGVITSTEFSDLSPLKMLHAFRIFSSWPGYEESVFKILQQQFFEDYMTGLQRLDCDVK